MALQHSVIAYRLEFDELIKVNKKRCTKCERIKNLEEFSKELRKYRGYANLCTVCASLSWRERKGKGGSTVEEVSNQHAIAKEQKQL